MSRETFFWLCSELEPQIRKKTTNYRKAVPASARLANTLWRLATNVEYRTLGHLFGVGLSTTGNIVRSCCHAIQEHLMPRYVKMPKDQQFREILSGFENVWGFPLCAGAVDGTHIPITGFLQETRHKYQGLFKDFPAPNLMFSRTILF